MQRTTCESTPDKNTISSSCLFLLKILCLFALLFISSIFTGKAGISGDTATKKPSLLDRKLRVEMKNISLKKALEVLHNSYGIDFIYSDEQIREGVQVYVANKEYTLAGLLDLLLKNAGLTYFLIEEQIGLAPRTLTETIEIDSNRQARIYTPANGKAPDLTYYKKVQFKSFGKISGKKKKMTYYLRRNFSFETEGITRTDSTREMNDTLVSRHRIPARKVKRHNYFFQNPLRNSVVFRISPGAAGWKMEVGDPSKVDDLHMNRYSRSNKAPSLGLLWEHTLSPHLVASLGIGFLRIHKNGIQTNTKMNRLYYPYISSAERNPYSYHYSYFSVPAGLGYKIGNKTVYLLLSGALTANFFLRSNMSYFPIYQVMYYVDLNPLSTGSDVYYNNANEVIQRQKVRFRPLIFSFALSAEGNWIVSKHHTLLIATALTGFSGSIYRNDTPVQERPGIWSFSIGYKYNFK